MYSPSGMQSMLLELCGRAFLQSIKPKSVVVVKIKVHYIEHCFSSNCSVPSDTVDCSINPTWTQVAICAMPRGNL